MASSAPAETAAARAFDPLRDGPLRLLGYANEVGEAFRPIIPRLVAPTYAVSVGYVVMDTIDKTRKAKEGEAVAVAADTFVWQMLASVVLPGVTIGAATQLTRHTVAKMVPKAIATPLPTAVGLCAIPFIVAPLDEFSTHLMDEYVRPRFS